MRLSLVALVLLGCSSDVTVPAPRDTLASFPAGGASASGGRGALGSGGNPTGGARVSTGGVQSFGGSSSGGARTVGAYSGPTGGTGPDVAALCTYGGFPVGADCPSPCELVAGELCYITCNPPPADSGALVSWFCRGYQCDQWAYLPATLIEWRKVKC